MLSLPQMKAQKDMTQVLKENIFRCCLETCKGSNYRTCKEQLIYEREREMILLISKHAVIPLFHDLKLLRVTELEART